MGKCYICDTPLETYIDSTTANHEEHVIPQAIGGQLKVSGILCKECGGEKYLGGSIDKPFSDIFLLITERLNINKDRKTKSVGLTGKLTLLKNDDCIDVSLKDNVLTHRKPEYKIDKKEKVVYIYANKVVAKNFRKKVENDLCKRVTDYHNYTIKIVSDLTTVDEFIGVFELPFNLNNKTFESGLVKIAIEFALSKGIDISVINHLIDKNQRTIISNNTIIPYYPISKVEETIEYLRTSIDNSFMSHSLVLFSQRQINDDGFETKQLYCFIELFGTFQYFVVLNDNYQGANIEPISFSQRIIKESNSEFKIGMISPKDISIYINELGLSYTDFDGKTDNEIKKYIENIYNKKNKYIYDYEKNIKDIIERIFLDSILNSDENIIKLVPNILSHFYSDVDKDEFHVTFFRSRIIKDNKVFSIIPEINELYRTDVNKFKRYTYFKFKELEQFVEKNQST